MKMVRLLIQVPRHSKPSSRPLDTPSETRAQEDKTAPQAHPLHAGEAEQEAEAIETTEKSRRGYGVSARTISELS